MKQKINIEDFDKKLPFGIPDGYFETFPSRMIAQLEQPKKSIRFRKSLKIWISIVAMFVGMLLVGKFYFMPSHSAKVLSEVSVDTYDNYVLSQVDESQLIDIYVNNYPSTNK